MAAKYLVRKRNFIDTQSESQDSHLLQKEYFLHFLKVSNIVETNEQALALARSFLSDFISRVIQTISIYACHFQCTDIRLIHVLLALEHFGIREYGFDHMCEIEWPHGREVFHVTELIELQTVLSKRQENSDSDSGIYHKRIDLLSNLKKNYSGDEYEDEDSEWSWEQCSDEGGEEATENVSNNALQESIKLAQDLCDQYLAIPSDKVIEDADTEVGQGYYSDFDGLYPPAHYAEWLAQIRSESKQWVDNGCKRMKLDKAREGNVLNDVLDVDERNSYIIPRQLFASHIRARTLHHRKISSAALSALHNAVEWHLYMNLTQGTLRNGIMTLILEGDFAACKDKLAASEEALEKERAIVNRQEKEIAELKAMQAEFEKKIVRLEKCLCKGEDKENAMPVNTMPCKKLNENKEYPDEEVPQRKRLQSELF